MNVALPPACTHHWLIATPDGDATCPARCKKCGAVRDFLSGADDYVSSWNWNQGLHQYSPNNPVDAYSLGQAMGDR